MSEFQSYIAIGFDRGEADFALSMAIIQRLSYDEMQKLRAMIPVAIAQAEQIWASRPGQQMPVQVAEKIAPIGYAGQQPA